ncbi:MAG: epoxyqueuosine reductase, partial [Chloroflexi bacterium]|nr:epoxyqueuosine reductase [Chloroflexota bacterium]
GNSKEADSIPALAKVLQEEEEPLIRQHATWALGQIGNQEALDLLQNAAKRELNEKVLEEIRDVLNNSFIK